MKIFDDRNEFIDRQTNKDSYELILITFYWSQKCAGVVTSSALSDRNS